MVKHFSQLKLGVYHEIAGGEFDSPKDAFHTSGEIHRNVSFQLPKIQWSESYFDDRCDHIPVKQRLPTSL